MFAKITRTKRALAHFGDSNPRPPRTHRLFFFVGGGTGDRTHPPFALGRQSPYTRHILAIMGDANVEAISEKMFGPSYRLLASCA